jgi:hypothetical protein
VIASLFRNWRFRADKPAFAPGEEIRAYLTGFDAGSGRGEVRIGDTLLMVHGVDATQLDQLVTLRVESFDVERASGTAVLSP